MEMLGRWTLPVLVPTVPVPLSQRKSKGSRFV